MPSLDEIMFMLDRRRFDTLSKSGTPAGLCDAPMLRDLSDELLAMGVAVVGFKLGDRGLYIRASDDAERLACLSRLWPDADVAAASRAALLQSWQARELYSPCFAVDVAGTTGCGDCTIAGFLAALLKAHTPEDALTTAVAVGACAAERPDAFTGVPPWPDVQARISQGWPKRPSHLDIPPQK